MFDFESFFAENNIIALKNCKTGKVYFHSTSDDDYDWSEYENSTLSCVGHVTGSGEVKFEIQSIVHLTERGDVDKKLFDRVTDMPPILKTGMFVEVKYSYLNTYLGIVVENKIIFQDGTFAKLDEFNNGVYPYGNSSLRRVKTIWGKDINSFADCKYNNSIWKDKD